ncbi:MAG TPA: DUF2254 family protein [Motilibacteraceae bacterium]|nr:DUF2254 family protein [Motilibacteraceae bacterium]
MATTAQNEDGGRDRSAEGGYLVGVRSPAGHAASASRSVRRRQTRPRVLAALRDFALVPFSVVAGFAALAVLSILADQTKSFSALDGLRGAVGHVIGAQAANAALQAVATGLVTVTSITFSVLLLAVQQTASSLSPVVFDQFLRRRANQAFLGFFVGLALFSYVVMAAVQDKMPPIMGAAIAVVLTIVALLILIVLVYTTISQMRPTNVVSHIRGRVLDARRREAALIACTRRTSTGEHDVLATYYAEVTGYLTSVDLDRLRAALQPAENAEVELLVTVGQAVAVGDPLALVRDGEQQRAEDIAREVAAAFNVTEQRDIADDASTGIDTLGNIAWTSGSTAKQNPEVAREVLHALKDVAARWMVDDPVEPQDDPLPVVYRDDDLDRVLDWLYSLLVSSHESHQHLLAADVLAAYAALWRLADDPTRGRLRRDLDAAEPLLDEMPPSPMLDRERRQLAERMQDQPSSGSAVADVRERQTVRR